MAYRPYPNAARALRQIDRHYPAAPVLQMPECLRPMAESLDSLRVNAQRAVESWRPDFVMGGRTGAVEPYPLDEYCLSSRPGDVGGPS